MPIPEILNEPNKLNNTLPVVSSATISTENGLKTLGASVQPVFARASTAYNSTGTEVATGVPRLEQGYKGIIKSTNPNFLLHDAFLTNKVAPLGETRTCEPGPGTLTIVDTENKLSTSNGKLVCSGGKATPAYGDPGFGWQSASRVSGYGCVVKGLKFPSSVSTLKVGTRSVTSTNPTDGVAFTGPNVVQALVNNTVINVSTIAVGDVVDFIHVLRSSGSYLFSRANGGQSTLLWVDNAQNYATVYPSVGNYNAAFELDGAYVISLAKHDARFATDDGLCTSVLTNPSAGATATMTSDAVVEWLTTYTTGQDQGLDFRRVDANNYWDVNISTTGALTLYEVTGGVVTSRATVAAAVSAAAHRIVIVPAGNTYTVYLDNVSKLTYTDPSSNSINGTGIVLVKSAATTRLASYPRRVTLPVEIEPTYNLPTDYGDKGAIMIEEGTTNLVADTQPLAAPKVVNLAAGTYTCSIDTGTGSIALSGGPTGTVTKATAVTFTLAGATDVTFTPTGTVTKWQVENKPYKTSWHPSTRAAESLTLDVRGLLRPEEGAIGLWVYHKDVAATYAPLVLYLHPADISGNIILYIPAGSGTYTPWFNNTEISALAQAFPSVGWHYLMLRWKGRTVGSVLDSTYKNTTISRPIREIAPTLYIGSRYDGTRQLNTLIQSPRLFSRWPSDQEIKDIVKYGPAQITATGTSALPTYDNGRYLDFSGANNSDDIALVL
jgi:hypothetical protein